MLHFRNNKRPFSHDRFKSKMSFNFRNKDAATETYLSCLGERLLDIQVTLNRFNNVAED